MPYVTCEEEYLTSEHGTNYGLTDIVFVADKGIGCEKLN
jgi:hypothetical protein